MGTISRDYVLLRVRVFGYMVTSTDKSDKVATGVTDMRSTGDPHIGKNLESLSALKHAGEERTNLSAVRHEHNCVANYILSTFSHLNLTGQKYLSNH